MTSESGKKTVILNVFSERIVPILFLKYTRGHNVLNVFFKYENVSGQGHL